MKSKPGALLLLLTIVLVEAAMLLTPGHNHANDVTLPLATACLSTLLTCTLTNLRLRTVLLATTSGYVIALLIKIGIDFQFDPTSHNLFPFEIAIAAVLAFITALVGATIGVLYKQLSKTFRQQKK